MWNESKKEREKQNDKKRRTTKPKENGNKSVSIFPVWKWWHRPMRVLDG